MKNQCTPQIYTYLTPNPFDSDDYAEEDNFSWIPGYVAGEDEDETPSFFREENTRLLNSIMQSFSDDILAALQRLQPLLDKFYLRNVNLALDVSGHLLPKKSTLAGYHYHYSQPAQGNYSFSVDRNMIYRKALFLRDGNNPALPDLNLWEHELIHLYDHEQLVAASMLKDSEIAKNNLDYYCLKFREEGLANLFDLMDGKIRDIQGLVKAKEKFITCYREVEKKLQGHTSTTKALREDLYKGFDFYEIGPWLILGILHHDFQFLENELDFESIIQKAAAGEVTDDAIKIEVLKRTFYIDNQYFLSTVSEWLKSAVNRPIDSDAFLTAP